MINSKTINTSSTCGFLMIAAAMVVPIIKGPYYEGTWYHYLYAAGAAIMLICSILSPYKGSDRRLRSLNRIQNWSSIIFAAATFFLFWPGATMRDWVAFTLAGAVLRGYSSIAIANHLRKQQSDNK